MEVNINTNNEIPNGYLQLKLQITAEVDAIRRLLRFMVDNDFVTEEAINDAYGQWCVLDKTKQILGK